MTPQAQGVKKRRGKKKKSNFLTNCLRGSTSQRSQCSILASAAAFVKNAIRAISVKATCFRKGTRSRVVMTKKPANVHFDSDRVGGVLKLPTVAM